MAQWMHARVYTDFIDTDVIEPHSGFYLRTGGGPPGVLFYHGFILILFIYLFYFIYFFLSFYKLDF